jgi:hypothetical protein
MRLAAGAHRADGGTEAEAEHSNESKQRQPAVGANRGGAFRANGITASRRIRVGRYLMKMLEAAGGARGAGSRLSGHHIAGRPTGIISLVTAFGAISFKQIASPPRCGVG